MSNEELKNTNAERDEEAVSHLLAGLNRVEAPKNFEFKVKARIAQGQPRETTGSRLFPALRLAVPAALLASLGGYFVLSGVFVPGESTPIARETRQSVLPAATAAPIQTPAEAIAETVAVQPDNVPAAPTPAAVRRNSTVASTRQAFDVRPASRADTPERPGGSVVLGTRVEEPIYPKGLNPNVTPIEKPDAGAQNKPVKARDFLALLGVEAAADGMSLKASSVRPKSIGDKSGVKAGDVIEAVNDTPVNASTEFTSPFNGRSITVRREGKSVKLSLTP